MSRSPFIPAIIVFLFSSVFSFAASVLEGQWERLDGRALLQVRIDDQGHLKGRVTSTGTESSTSLRPLPLRQRLRALLRRFSSSPAKGTIVDRDQPSKSLGTVTLKNRSRIILRTPSGKSSEWRRIL